MDYRHKQVGIWGLGVSGKAILSHLLTVPCHIAVLDRVRDDSLERLIQENRITFFTDPEQRELFLARQDIMIPSPGIALEQYLDRIKQLLPEADLFAQLWHKPLIAITGTLGKTSITTLLSQLLAADKLRVATGGNIGTGMLDLIKLQEQNDCAVLELSSYQLEYAEQFAPDLAIITNIYPNHLDRHKTFEAYAQAKLRLVAHQKRAQTVFAPLEHAALVRDVCRQEDAPRCAWFTKSFSRDEQKAFAAHSPAEQVYTVDQNWIMRCTRNERVRLVELAALPPLSYPENWLILVGALDLLGHNPAMVIEQAKNTLEIPHNRLELVDTVNGVSFYNDSKSTIMEATLAALAVLAPKPVHLIFGGLSKGVDRGALVGKLASCASISCFGAEAEALQKACSAHGLNATAYSDLEAAFAAVAKKAQPGSCVLLSPGGTSFDLYKNYEERGQHFVQLVTGWAQQH